MKLNKFEVIYLNIEILIKNIINKDVITINISQTKIVAHKRLNNELLYL